MFIEKCVCLSVHIFRFDINFQTSANTAPRDDIGLHLSVRLAEGYVARNSIEGGVWGEEQNGGDLPIQPGQKYEIIILSDNREFKVSNSDIFFNNSIHKLIINFVNVKIFAIIKLQL